MYIKYKYIYIQSVLYILGVCVCVFIDHVVTISRHLNVVVSFLGNSLKGSLLPFAEFRPYPEIFKEYTRLRRTLNLMQI